MSFQNERSGLVILNPIIFALSTISDNNEVIASSVSRTKEGSKFCWKGKPVSLQDYLQKIYFTSHYGDACFLFALCLLRRLEQTKAFTAITRNTVQYVYFVCCSLASKYLEDVQYPEFGKLGGMTSKQLKRLELDYFVHLGFNISIDVDEVFDMSRKICFAYFHQTEPNLSTSLLQMFSLPDDRWTPQLHLHSTTTTKKTSKKFSFSKRFHF